MIRKKIIYGCESRGDSHSPYLTRYTLLDTTSLQICLHVFHRSDAAELHDHPWPFASLILWRGYIEEVAQKYYVNRDRTSDGFLAGWVSWSRLNGLVSRKRKWPGMVIFRKAQHAHRVELIDGKPAVTLVFMGRKIRDWGFFTSRGWESFKSYFERMGC